jgi:hypothetical protein
LEKEKGDYFLKLPKQYLKVITSIEIPEIEDFPNQNTRLQEAKRELEKI